MPAAAWHTQRCGCIERKMLLSACEERRSRDVIEPHNLRIDAERACRCEVEPGCEEVRSCSHALSSVALSNSSRQVKLPDSGCWSRASP